MLSLCDKTTNKILFVYSFEMYSCFNLNGTNRKKEGTLRSRIIVHVRLFIFGKISPLYFPY